MEMARIRKDREVIPYIYFSECSFNQMNSGILNFSNENVDIQLILGLKPTHTMGNSHN